MTAVEPEIQRYTIAVDNVLLKPGSVSALELAGCIKTLWRYTQYIACIKRIERIAVEAFECVLERLPNSFIDHFLSSADLTVRKSGGCDKDDKGAQGETNHL